MKDNKTIELALDIKEQKNGRKTTAPLSSAKPCYVFLGGVISADSVRVAYPLFQEEGGGSIPTSALQLHIAKINKQTGWKLNRLWHSRFGENE